MFWSSNIDRSIILMILIMEFTGRAAHRNSEKLALLLDEWTSCQGQWKESNLYLRLSETTRHRKRGARCWLTRAELVQKYGDVEAATHIWESKLAEDDGSGAQIRPHPDCPKVLDPRMHIDPLGRSQANMLEFQHVDLERSVSHMPIKFHQSRV